MKLSKRRVYRCQIPAARREQNRKWVRDNLARYLTKTKSTRYTEVLR